MPLPSVLSRDQTSKSSIERGNNDVDDEDDYDDGNRNIILSLIGQLRPGSDLSRITLPTFILERKSMLERITNILQHPEMLVKATAQQDPEQRFVEVVRWYMSGWHIAPKAVKKPLNPVLGEYFSCYWDFPDNSKAYYVAEQTSHHAPKSSYFYIYPQRKIRADGIVIPKSKFLGNSAASIMEGIARLQFGEHMDSRGVAEEYELTQPNIYARNVLVGSLKLEIGDKSIVRCPALDMECVVEFKVKGYITGTYHEIKGTISKGGKPLYELSGKWNEVIYIKALTGGSHQKRTVFFDCSQDKVHRPLVRPIEEQGEMESRRLWEKVCIALGERNQKVATDEKFEIEEHQRQLQKQRNEGHEPPFEPRLFMPIDNSLGYIFWIDGLLRQARSPADVEEIIQLAMPVLPGARFPANFDQSASRKAHETPSFSHHQQQAQQQAQQQQAPQGSNGAVGAAGVAGAGGAAGAGRPRALSEEDVFVDAPEFH